MLKSTDAHLDLGKIDHEPFKFKHKLTDHPALKLENLSRVIPRLPKHHVFYSEGLSRIDDFDRAHIEKPNGMGIEQTIAEIQSSNSYIMVRSPEEDVSFRPLFHDLLGDMDELTRLRGGKCVPGSMLYMFIASPGAVTPFHFDRYSTMLYQFRGRKTVWVAPPWDERVISVADTEAFASRSGKRPVWRDELGPLGTDFCFSPGEALHIPFISGHHVKNGDDDVSISLSIIFNTRETSARLRALALNYAAKKYGLSPRRVGASDTVDALKSAVWRCASFARDKLSA